MAGGRNMKCVRVWVLALCLGLMSTAGFAQEHPGGEQDTLTGDGQTSTPAITTPQRIGVFGDSIADGIWVGLRRNLRGDNRAGEILQMSEVSTGLTNFVYRDISEKTRDQLAEQDFDVAVVLFGSNDIQGIRHDSGAVYNFRSADWETVYRERIRDVVTQLQSDGATVYWVGLPVMRSSRYNANTIYLNGIFREEVEALGAVFISTRAVTGDAEGNYSAYLADAGGTQRLVRADDGIHFTLPGYTRLSAPVAAAIREGWDNPRPQIPLVAEAEIEDEAPDALADWLNVAINGQAYICQPVTLDAPDPNGAETGTPAVSSADQ